MIDVNGMSRLLSVMTLVRAFYRVRSSGICAPDNLKYTYVHFIFGTACQIRQGCVWSDSLAQGRALTSTILGVCKWPPPQLAETPPAWKWA